MNMNNWIAFSIGILLTSIVIVTLINLEISENRRYKETDEFCKDVYGTGVVINANYAQIIKRLERYLA